MAGTASALLVHAASLENQFVDQGFSYNNEYGHAIWTNDFVLLGPAAAEATKGDVLARSPHNIAQAFANMAEKGAAAAEIKLGRRSHLSLGNLDARRDWSDARDVVRGFLMILDQSTADDFILASGTTHSVRDITQTAFASLGLDLKRYVRSEEHLLRPADPVHLCGDATKARTVLGWQPQSSVHNLIAEMAQAELARFSSRP